MNTNDTPEQDPREQRPDDATVEQEAGPEVAGRQRPDDTRVEQDVAPEPGAAPEQPTAGPQAPPQDGSGAQGGSGWHGASGAGAGPGPGAERRLTRSRSDRMLGGVCGGLGRYFNADPMLFRIGAVVLVLAVGTGLLAYLAAVLLLPADDAPAAGPSQGRRSGLAIAGIVALLIIASPFLLGGGVLLAGLLLPLALLVAAGVLVWWLVSGEGPSGDARDIARRAALGVGVLFICWIVAILGAWATAAGPGWIVAVAVIVAGAAILAGAFLRPIRWLILPAVTLALTAGAVSAAGIDLDGGIGERHYGPASALELRDRYELGMGELVLDLRDTDLPPGDVPVEIDLGVGEALVLVPDDVCVAAQAQVGMGSVSMFSRDNDGVDVDFSETPDAPAGATRLLLRADVGLGELRVSHEDGRYDFGDHRAARLEGGEDWRLGNAACSDSGEDAPR